MPEMCQTRRTVVVGFDGSPGSRQALEWAAEEAELRRTRLVVLHADLWSPDALAVPVFGGEDAYEEGVLEEGVQWVSSTHPAVEVVGRRVPPPAGESLVASSADALLLVVGSRGLGPLQQMVVGSISRHCVDHAHCPVVVVRGDAAPTGHHPPAS